MSARVTITKPSTTGGPALPTATPQITSTHAPSRVETRSPHLPALARKRQRHEAAAIVRPWRLLRCLVLGAAFPAVVRAERLCRARALAARSRRFGWPRNDVRHGPRRFRRRCRTRGFRIALSAGADRTFDGCRRHRAPAGDASGPRGCVDLPRAADGTPAD